MGDWKPLPHVPEDPGSRDELAREMLHLLATDRAALEPWIVEKIPLLHDVILIAERAVEMSEKEHVFAAERETLQRMLRSIRAEQEKYASFLENIAENDVIAALHRAVYDMKTEGTIPPDWRTREGDVVSVLLWLVEFFEEIGRTADYKKEGDKGQERISMLRAYDAIETAMDRLLTLTPEQRAEMEPLVQPLYEGMMSNRTENLGPDA